MDADEVGKDLSRNLGCKLLGSSASCATHILDAKLMKPTTHPIF